ncbi:MAG: helicase HerA-like domain-containing protein, partial [Pauljensenia sp.]
MSDDVDALRAQLAEAQAKAAAAEAEAARAKAEAVEAALAAARTRAGVPPDQTPDSAVTSPDPVPDVAVATSSESSPDPAGATAALPQDPVPSQVAPPSSGQGADAGLSPFARRIRNDYSFDPPSLTIGTLLDEGAPVPGVTVGVPLGVLNRHMLVAGATGTGKTRTLQLLTEGLSAAGTPVLLCDVKGDLTGLAEPGTASDKLTARTQANGQDWQPASFPVELLSLGGVQTQFPGTTVRTSVSDFGP